jgi:cell division cycle 2-like protein
VQIPFLTSAGNELLTSLLALNPARRPTASEVLAHPYFRRSETEVDRDVPNLQLAGEAEEDCQSECSKRGEAPRLDGQVADFSGILLEENEESGLVSIKTHIDALRTGMAHSACAGQSHHESIVPVLERFPQLYQY